jgi:hypothetical protein
MQCLNFQGITVYNGLLIFLTQLLFSYFYSRLYNALLN